MCSYEGHSREGLVSEIQKLKASLNDLKKFKLLFDCSPEAVFFSTEDSRLLDCNPAAVELYGYSRDEMTGLTMADLISEDSANALLDNLKEERLRGGINTTTWNRRKNGESFPVEIFTQLITFDGALHRFLVIHDLAKYGESTEPHHKSPLDGDHLFSSFGDEEDFMLESDPEGMVTSANDLFFRQTGYTHKDIESGLRLIDLLSKKDRSRAGKQIRNALAGKQMDISEYTLLTKTGDTIPMLGYF